MWQRGISDADKQRMYERIETMGRWLWGQEPPQTVLADLFGHRRRSLMAAAVTALRSGRRDRAEAYARAAETCLLELLAANRKKR